MEMKWISFDDELPKKRKEWVLVFLPILGAWADHPSLSVSCQKAEYARYHAKKDGYTHWCKIPYPLPLPPSEIQK